MGDGDVVAVGYPAGECAGAHGYAKAAAEDEWRDESGIAEPIASEHENEGEHEGADPLLPVWAARQGENDQ